MNKAILLSIKPKWVAKILNGEKTIEIRKTIPKCDLPIDVYIYCTKDNKHGLYWVNKWVCVNQKGCVPSVRNGKVVAKFTLKDFDFVDSEYYYPTSNKWFKREDCLTIKERKKYLNGKQGYAWHIEDLVIFDKPKELWQFEKFGSWKKYQFTCKKALAGRCNYGWGAKGYIGCEKARLTKAPQNYCYVESEE